MFKLLWLSFDMPILTGNSAFILGSLRTHGFSYITWDHYTALAAGLDYVPRTMGYGCPKQMF